MVDEESGHRPVFGLAPGAPAASVPMGPHSIEMRVEAVGDPVGLSSRPAQVYVLHMLLPKSCKKEQVLAEAQQAYDRHFATGGLDVFYTRKVYESVEWQKFGSIPLRPLSSVRLPQDLERDLLQDAKAFLRSEAEYSRLGRPYKRVYCLHGPPGTGKTSVVMALASELRRPVGIFNVDSLRDDTFIELLAERPDNSILLFEDVDALFKGRGSAGGGMTFSTLLNALDGVLHPRGALIFLTTNHLDKLDDALRRPGRVDRLLHIPLADVHQASEIWRIFFPKEKVPTSALQRACGKTGIAPARVSEILFVHRDDPKAALAAIAKIKPETST